MTMDPNRDRQIREELEYHLAATERELVQAGWSPVAARDEALRRFGAPREVRLACLEEGPRPFRARVGALVADLWHDIGAAGRLVRQRSIYAVVAIGTLTLAIAANTAIFSMARETILRPLPYPHADRLLMLWEENPAVPRMSLSWMNYGDWRRLAEGLDELAVYRRTSLNLTGADLPRRLPAAQVSANLFRAFGLPPAIGRTFSDDEDQQGGRRVTVVSHRFWTDELGGDPATVGRALRLDDEMWTVVGVMPPAFDWPTRTDIWVPIAQFSGAPDWQERGNHPGIFGIGRLSEGVSMTEAQSQIDGVARRLAAEFPRTNRDVRLVYTGLQELSSRPVRPVLAALGAGVLVLLIVAVANLTALSLGRAVARRREVAIRAALGAGRGRLVRQLVTETVVLALIASVAGLALARGATTVLVNWYPTGLPAGASVPLDVAMLAFTVLVGAGAGLAAGLWPAVGSARVGAVDALRDVTRSSTASRGTRRILGAVVVGELALAVVLLVAAGLLTRSAAAVLGVAPGFDPAGVGVFRVALPPSTYPDAAAQTRFVDRLLARVGAIPGVLAVATTSNLPLADGSQTSLAVADPPPPTDENWPMAEYAIVSPDYFDVMRIPLRAGRGFDAGTTAEAARVALVDEGFAARLWPGESSVGKRVLVSRDEPPIEIIGVVGGVRYVGLDVEPRFPQIYFPVGAENWSRFALLLRGADGRVPPVAVVRAAVRDVDPNLPVFGETTLSALLDSTTTMRRMSATLMALFAGSAAILAIAGIYGVVVRAVAERRREFGVRLALGATRDRVLASVLWWGLGLAATGLAVGLVGSWLSTRLLRGLLFGVGAADPVAYAGAIGMILVASLVACFRPAWQASRVDPAVTLRD